MARHREDDHGGLFYPLENVARTSIGASPDSSDHFHYLSEVKTPGIPPLILSLNEVENLDLQI